MRCTILVLMLVLLAGPAYAQATPGADTGQRIGTIVKSALDVALPGVTSLVEAIWGKRQPNAQIRKPELEAEVKRVREQLYQDAQKAIRPVSAIAAELAVVTPFMEGAIQANQRVILMRSRLNVDKVDTPTWQLLATDWKVANTNLNRFATTTDKQLGSVRDLPLRANFRALRDIHNSLVIEIGDAVKNQNNPGLLRELLGDLARVLNGTDSLVALQIAELRQDIDALSNWASAAAGGATPPPPPNKADLQQIVNDALAVRKK